MGRVNGKILVYVENIKKISFCFVLFFLNLSRGGVVVVGVCYMENWCL